MNAALITERKSSHETGYKNVYRNFHISYETEDELFSLFFKKYDNGVKYNNDIFYSFASRELQNKYRVWVSDINNYARNGGDMW